jgi:hypothetical protein
MDISRCSSSSPAPRHRNHVPAARGWPPVPAHVPRRQVQTSRSQIRRDSARRPNLPRNIPRPIMHRDDRTPAQPHPRRHSKTPRHILQIPAIRNNPIKLPLNHFPITVGWVRADCSVPSRLRTVRESFPSYGSSLSKQVSAGYLPVLVVRHYLCRHRFSCCSPVCTPALFLQFLPFLQSETTRISLPPFGVPQISKGYAFHYRTSFASYTVSAVSDVFAARIRALRSKDQGCKNAGGGWRGNGAQRNDPASRNPEPPTAVKR